MNDKEKDTAMTVSVEIPVVKGGWLRTCVDAIRAQTYPHWKLYLLWDGGDDLSKEVLQDIQKENNPKISIYFSERQGIANARHFLTEHSEGDFLLPVDDDDLLTPDAVEKMVDAAGRMPWAGLIRSQRGFIDVDGKVLDMPQWFPFQPRRYVHGMTTDLYNQTHPYLIRRSVYDKTTGWEGFPEYLFAGEDCDIFLKLEEHAEIELIDDCLYYYRINPERTSNTIGDSAAFDMWQRLAEKTIERRGLPLKRVNEEQPFQYERVDTPLPTKDMIDVVIPFWEANEEEIAYEFSRPSQFTEGTYFPVSGVHHIYSQVLRPPLPSFNRFEIVCSSNEPISGRIVVSFFSKKNSSSPAAVAEHTIRNELMVSKFLPMEIDNNGQSTSSFRRMEVIFYPEKEDSNDVLIIHIWKWKKKRFWNRNKAFLWMRLFKNSPSINRKRLDLCLQSLKKAGISDDSFHVIEKRQSSAANRNDGIRRSTKPYICFVDDDIEIVSPDIFEVLLEKLHSLNMDMVGPKILTDAGMIFCADPFFNEKLMPNPSGLGESDNSQYDYTSIVPWLPTTFLLTKREVCLSVGGYDENYVGSQHEDVDFCLKARSRGFQLCYTGEVSVTHFNCARNNSHSVNFKYFMSRWERHKDLFSSEGMKKIGG